MIDLNLFFLSCEKFLKRIKIFNASALAAMKRRDEKERRIWLLRPSLL
jgi:hypothetical protein